MLQRIPLPSLAFPVTLCGDPLARDVIIRPVGGHDAALLDSEVRETARLCGHERFCLAFLTVSDWDNDLAPWSAPAVFGGRSFGDGAADTLGFITDGLIPQLEADFPAPVPRRVLIAGYSLAGLFALWAAAVSDCFAGAAGVSPSLWYPGWAEFSSAHPMRTKAVYLSLGDREEHTRNAVMARVGDAVRAQYAALEASGTDCILEWNSGGHFRDSDLRTARGSAWMLNRLSKKGDNMI